MISQHVAKLKKNTSRKKIAVYMQIRPLVQQGTAYRLVSPFEEKRSAVQYVAENGSSSVFSATTWLMI
jgi:alpha-galactosidase